MNKYPADRVAPGEIDISRCKVLLDTALTAMIEAVPDYVMVLNQERQILAVNSYLLNTFGIEQIEALLGQRPGEALGCLFSQEGPDGCGTGSHCTTCGAVASVSECQRFNVQAARECRLSIVGAEGKSLDLLVVSTPVVIDDMRLVVCILKDIGIEKWRNVLERVFFHDVLNTAGGIKGLASLIEQGTVDNPEKEGFYKQWLVKLSEQLIDEIMHQRRLMAAEQGVFSPDPGLVEVGDLVREVYSLYLHDDVASGVIFQLGEVAELKIVSDVAILRRILGNLVKNALEATPAGGVVTMSAASSDALVTFTVHNPGVMSREVQLQLFQRSFSTKGTTGRGIGTYSVKLFAERYLKGRVSFISTETDGTIFSLAIPHVITVS